MAIPNNILQQVITYQESMLGILQNQNCFYGIANTKFKNFQDMTANLGDTVSFDLPPRFTTVSSLKAQPEGAAQRVLNLTVDQQMSTSYEFTAQQFIFNVEDYLEKFGMSAIAEMGAQIEANLAQIAVDAPYRFYGDGITPINSVNQLALALAFHRNFGAAKGKADFILSDIARAEIVPSMLNQFVPRRNEDAAQSWDVGTYNNSDFYTSNLLPLHEAGTIGNNGTTLTVSSVVTNSEGGVTAIEFSGAGTDADAIKKGDLGQFNDGVAGQKNVRFLTWTGHLPSASKVQFRVTADASSSGGSVTVSIFPALQAAAGKNQNVTTPIVPGMQVNFLPTHRAGIIMTGKPFFMAMPSLPPQDPFATSSMADPDTGISFRFTHGSILGQNQMINIHDAIWGKVAVPEYCTRVIFTENQ